MAKKGKIKKAILAGLTAYAASKMMKGKGPTDYEHEASLMKKKVPFVEDIPGDYKHKHLPPMKGHPGGWNWESDTFSSPPNPKKWYEKRPDWWPKKEGGSISASAWKKHGGVIKSQHAKIGKMIKAAQGTYAREDESLGMRLGKGKGTAKERNMSYGKWGSRKTDWAKSGKMIKARHGTMVTGGTAYVRTKLNGTLKTKTY
jgi:hypothetical protein